ncbi:acyl-CoA-binding protein [Tribonema minus]|uniref:Acyl-CoA-binding protein n=1 Tax=Tribonema minus TaxID=303371 RepID=A0A835YP11_9STRA|nr:acyl-CoA-binding protein [Tribonema minus]
MEAQFLEAAERVKTATVATNEDKLKLYALFKQANAGDCSTSRPGMFDLQGKAKWDAWDALKGKTKEEAMAEYIAQVESIMAKQP